MVEGLGGGELGHIIVGCKGQKGKDTLQFMKEGRWGMKRDSIRGDRGWATNGDNCHQVNGEERYQEMHELVEVFLCFFFFFIWVPPGGGGWR